MEFLYLLRPARVGMLVAGPTEFEEAVVGRHFAYLAGLAAMGVLELAGRTMENDEATFGIALFRADDEEAAHSIMAGDPAIAEGVMTGELHPFRVAVRGERG